MCKVISLLTLTCFVCTSCCSIVRSPEQRVTIQSLPDQADLYVDGYYCGQTPVQVALARKYNHSIYVAKEGYQPQETQLRSSHTLKSGYNLATPLIGAGLGTLVGLACCGSPGGFPVFLVGTMIGGLCGLCASVSGGAIDIYKRADCDLYPGVSRTPCPDVLLYTLTD